MFSKLLKRKPPVRAPENPSVPDGTIVWAIGDIHGRLDLLVPLVEAIQADAAASDAGRKVVIFLGDYIDRGPDSRGVIQYMAALPKDAAIEWRFLKGNHEETMLEFLEDPSVGARWCEYGGESTLRSYELRAPTLRHRRDSWEHLSSDLAHRLSASEKDFLTGLQLSISLGDYFFSHAGARPGIVLDEQTERDLLWIRNSFLDSEAEFDRVVVHGHTPSKSIHAEARRIGIDTRAYDSGILTALRLHGSRKSLIATEVSPEQRVTIRTTSL